MRPPGDSRMTATLRLDGSLATSDCSASTSPPTRRPLSRNAVVSGLPISMRVTAAACAGAEMHAIATVEAAASTAASDNARPTRWAAMLEARREAIIRRSSLTPRSINGISSAVHLDLVDLRHGLGDEGRLQAQLRWPEIGVDRQRLLELGNRSIEIAVSDVDLRADGQCPS